VHPPWLEPAEEESWRSFQFMQMRLTASLARDLAESSGLSYQDYIVLVALTDSADGELRLFELAQATGWEKSRMSRHVARMVERGLVSRRRCETDRRGSYVVVSMLGRREIAAAAPGHVASVCRRFIDLLEASQLAELGRISRLVLEGLDRENELEA